MLTDSGEMMGSLRCLIGRLQSRFDWAHRKIKDVRCEDALVQSGIIFNVGGNRLSGVKLLGMSKVGHLSWIGCLGHELVKIYQTFSAAHADFIEQVSRDPALREYFPEVINRCNEYLVVRWIEGANLRPSDVIKRGELLQKMAELQVALHSRRFPVAADCFNYLTWLRNRCRRYLGPFTHNEAISNMMEMIEKYEPEPTTLGVCHPDVTPRNLVVERRIGKLKLVDNELLNQGWFCLIDLFNTHASLGGSEDIANRYIESYRKLGGDLSLLSEHRRFFLAAWGLRVVGAALQAGDLSLALKLANEFGSGCSISHPLIRAAERTLKCH